MGNGASKSVHAIGKLTGTICDQCENQLNKSMMQEVTHLPSGMFNLFSLTLMQMKGWLLFGNIKKIWLEKDGDKIIFREGQSLQYGVVCRASRRARRREEIQAKPAACHAEY
jgi:hypothetical protein